MLHSNRTRSSTYCYSPQKQTNLNQTYLNKSLVKITGIKPTPSKRFHTQEEEYAIPKYAEIAPTSLSKSFNEAFSNQLCTITEVLGKDLYETIDIKAKVLKKQENKKVLIKDFVKAKCKTDCLIADETNSVKLVLWESIIDKVHAGKTYHFKHMRVPLGPSPRFATAVNQTNR